MSLGIGINENVIIKSVSFDENKNWLTIEFRELTKEVFNPFEALQEEDVKEKPTTSLEIKMFNLKYPNPVKVELTAARKEEMVIADTNSYKGVLIHLLKGYLTTEQIGKWNMIYDGTGIDVNNFSELIKQDATLGIITKNMARNFIRLITPFLDDETQKFRLLLVRQSKDKHFPAFRTRFLDENPFWESMEIPADKSKLKFTKYEEKEGLTDSSVPSKDAAEKPEDSAPADVTSIFGQA